MDADDKTFETDSAKRVLRYAIRQLAEMEYILDLDPLEPRLRGVEILQLVKVGIEECRCGELYGDRWAVPV